jgi:hypothetical protein
MSDYFEFKNVFLPNGIYDSQIAQPTEQAKSHISTPASTPICTEEDQTSYHTDSSSPGYSDSDADGEVFKNIECTYQLVGIVERRTSWGDPEWWVVNINDPDEIKKITRPGLLGISGLFKYTNSNPIPTNSKVIVEITYNSNGCCKWKENKIISLL